MTRNILTSCIVLIGISTFAGIAFIQPQDPANENVRESQDAHQDHDDHAEADSLHDRMEGVQECVRGLFRSAADPAMQAESLEFITQLQEHILASKQLEPDSAADMPAEEREEYLLDYRKHMAEFLREVAEVELEIIAGDSEAAITRIRENLVQIRDESHDEFRIKDDDHS